MKVSHLKFCEPGDGCYVSEDNSSWNPSDDSDVCSGHTPRTFIFECNITCLCHGACRNRLVQKGSQLQLSVFWTGPRGWGLKTLNRIVKGQFVLEYHGEICTELETIQRAKKRPSNGWYSMSLDADWRAEAASDDSTALSKDALMFGNVARFLNHMCEVPNLVDMPVKIDRSDPRLYHIAFFATRDIDEYEELTWVCFNLSMSFFSMCVFHYCTLNVVLINTPWSGFQDYGTDFQDSTTKTGLCLCGGAFCRNPMSSL